MTVSVKMSFDTKRFERAMKDANLTKREKLEVLKAGAKTIARRQRQLVPVDTGATKRSIDVRVSGAGIGDTVDVGPTTEYAPVIEYGRGDGNYPAQPFVRPSIVGRGPVIQGQMTIAVNAILRRKGLLE